MAENLPDEKKVLSNSDWLLENQVMHLKAVNNTDKHLCTFIYLKNKV